ncbi:MAG TPA: hypothetical protein VFW23_10490 [Tepidisphaeraceae bacterium]|nr:hypothetical protein [Tepidisphaeraceae bacterium]
MSVTVDHETLEIEDLGFRTVGQVLTHVQRPDRLVINLLIDGEEPDLDMIGSVKRSPLAGHTIFIETAKPRQIALDALDEVEQQLSEADRLKSDAVDMLQIGSVEKAMQKLSGCFSTWQNAQQSIVKTAQLLRINLDSMRVDGSTLSEMVDEFATQLRQIKATLESRDFVALSDILTYETTQTNERWRQALDALRQRIGL